MWTTLALTPDDARQIGTWTYPPPYDVYDGHPAETAALLTPEYRYHAVRRDGQLVGFCCFGADARVPGGAYDGPHTDLGLGLRPDLTGQRLGPDFLNAVLAAAPAGPLRLTVATFNERARRLYTRHGFVETTRFTAWNGLEYVQMLRPAPSDHAG